MPDPTIDVNGEKVGLNTRMYGSSDVSTKFSVMSLSASSSNGMRPVPDTARRDDAISSASMYIC